MLNWHNIIFHVLCFIVLDEGMPIQTDQHESFVRAPLKFEEEDQAIEQPSVARSKETGGSNNYADDLSALSLLYWMSPAQLIEVGFLVHEQPQTCFLNRTT